MHTAPAHRPPHCLSHRLTLLLILLPCLIVTLWFIWGFGLYTMYLSLTKSTFLPNHTFVGLKQFQTLFSDPRWWVSYRNMFVFGSLYVGGCVVLGVSLAILIDSHSRGELLFRTIILYPMSLSLVVTGLAWQWLLNPTLGIQQLGRDLGFENFVFNWLVTRDKAIYTVVLAAVWHGTGLIMVLFLSGLKSMDSDIWKATRVDRIPAYRVYWHILLPQLRATLLTAVMLLGFQVVRSFDVVVALTNGGPGFASDVPARYVVSYFFERGRIGQGAAAAVIMVATMMVIVAPYLIFEVRRKSV